MKLLIVILVGLLTACATHPCKPTFPVPPDALMASPPALKTLPVPLPQKSDSNANK